jgi:L-fuconate dehydratase
MATLLHSLEAFDVRFPTSDHLDGSDAMNEAPDYSAAYCIVRTSEPGIEGHGMTFTIGRGNELCVRAIESLASLVIGRDLDAIEADMAGFWRALAGESQLRWVGPEKGVIHLATAAVVNAVWDLLARRAGKPLWKYVVDLEPERIVGAIDFRHITDALTPDEAVSILKSRMKGRAAREAEMLRDGYPAYTTSAGWLGYDDDKIRRLVREAIAAGWNHVKIKIGRDAADDLRRCAVVREELGKDRKLMVDANQVFDVEQAIEWIRPLAEFDLHWFEEPTSPDDVLGHARIARAIRPIGVATGEHCHNRVMFKQFMQLGAIDFVQLDACRLGGLNEVLAVMLLAARFDLPVCPHAGGVGLCEYVQHVSLIDYIAVSGSLENRVVEHAGHLHEHFVEPIVIRGGRYVPPRLPGYSIEMHADSRERFAFPGGSEWRSRKA